MGATDDTQPRSPFKDHPERLPQKIVAELDTQESARVKVPVYDDDAYYDNQTGGPGCLLWGFLLLVGLGFSLIIVLMAAAWGWTQGNRDADVFATSTQSAFINIQLQFIATEIVEGQTGRVGRRLEFLATLTPGVPEVPQLQQTATALYENHLPTATPPPTPTETPTPDQDDTPVVVIETSAPPDSTANTTASPFDIDQMWSDAQLHVRFDEYQEAYEMLDAIIRLDPDFQRTTVRALMNEVLITQAQQRYRSPDTDELAEAIRLTGLAEQYGSIGELNYERIMATYYLDIQSAIGAFNHPLAISLLNTVIYTYQDTYKGQDLRVLLFNEYVAYGDAWGFGNDHCKAVAQYDLALNLFANNEIQTKRDTAQQRCDSLPVEGIGNTPVPGQDPSSYSYPGVPPTAAP